MRKLMLSLFGVVDIETYADVQKTVLECLQMQQKMHDQDQAMITELSKNLVDTMKKVEEYHRFAVLGQYKYELILKYGCLDCFSVDGEWHNEKCPNAVDEFGNKQLVRRKSERPRTGKC